MTDTHAAAGAAIDAAAALVDTAARHLAEEAADDGRISVSKLDRHQVVAYDLAHAAAAVTGSRVMLAYAEHGDLEAKLAYAYIADAFVDIVGRLVGREAQWGVDPADLASAHDFVAAHRDPAFLEALADELPRHGTGPAHLDDEFDMVRDTFHRFAEDKIRPVAEHIHRTNADIPAEIIDGMAEIGGFGLSVPEEYGGFAAGGDSDYLAMCVATEELSWGSLGAGGALITRPEILTRAIVKGGTEEQKHGWLPQIASGERIVGVMVTEPDFGSDVAGVKVTAQPGRRRVRDQRREDVVHVRRSRRHADAPRPHRSRPHRSATAASRCSSSRSRRPRATTSRSTTAATGRWRAARSTRSATAACTPTRSRSTTGSCRPRTSSDSTAGSARASTSRWRASRTAACRPRRAPSA